MPVLEISKVYNTFFIYYEGYRYAGVQYGTQCYCGNSYGKHGSKEISDCRMECGGSGIYEDCGGIYANNVYDLEYERKNIEDLTRVVML